MRIQNNIMAMNAHRSLGINNNSTAKSLEKLSSGFKINRAGDDAAGLAISEKMRAQIKGLETAQANANDGISLIQTAEGALTEVHSMLNRMTELATKSANGTMQDAVDREALQSELKSLSSEIDRIAQGTNFNGINLLDGSLAGSNATSNGTTLYGSNVAKFEAAKVDGNTLLTDLSGGAVNAKDHFTLDGQTVVVDWTKKEFAEVAAMVAKDFTAAAITETEGKLIASKFQEAFNAAAKEQGVVGSVKVTFDTNKLSIESNNTGSGSQVGFMSTDKLDVADVDPTTGDAGDSVGFALFGKLTTVGNVAEAKKTYNGDTLAVTDTFQMVINGTSVSVAGPVVTKGTSTMEAAATALDGVVNGAIDAYNLQMGGLVAGDKGFLDKNDFTVSAGKDGGFEVAYSGDVENVNFSFRDIGDNTSAASLGISSNATANNGKGLQLQVGDTADSFQKVSVSVGNMSSTGLQLTNLNVGTQAGAADALKTIKTAINTVSTNRANLGALQNRLEHTVNNLGVTTENMTAAESRIRDVDMAKEMMNFTKNNILSQAAQAMLAQANQQPQGVLQLLR